MRSSRKRAASTVPAAALITGEPGSGKSRLLRESVTHLDSGRTVSVAGFEPTERIPLAAVGDLVRRLASVPDHGRRLESLVFGSNQPRGQGLLATFEAAHRALAAFGPLLVSIDDLQWVDAQSLALLHYLVRAAEATRSSLVVVAAARPSPAAVTFAKGMAGPLPDSRRASIELRGLPLDDGISLAQAIDDRLERRRRGGTVAPGRRIARSGSRRWRVEDRQMPSISSRTVCERCRPMRQRLLDTLAIGGRPFARDELAGLVDWPAKRLEHAARELVGRGLAIDVHGAIRLSHDLIREAAASDDPGHDAADAARRPGQATRDIGRGRSAPLGRSPRPPDRGGPAHGRAGRSTIDVTPAPPDRGGRAAATRVDRRRPSNGLGRTDGARSRDRATGKRPR